MVDKQRHQTGTGRVNSRGQSSAKPFPGVSAGGAADEAFTAVVTCFECRKPCAHLSFEGLLVARGGAGERGSCVVHGAWTTAAAAAAAAATTAAAAAAATTTAALAAAAATTAAAAAAATTTAALAAAAAFLGASTRLDALFRSGEGLRGGIFDCFPSAPRWRLVFSCDTEPAGAGRATAFLPPHPIPSSANAPASVNAPAADEPGESGPYVPAFHGVLPGSMSGFSAEGVAVDERERWCQASLSVPGATVMATVDAVAILDSGSGITTMSAGIANKFQAAFRYLGWPFCCGCLEFHRATFFVVVKHLTRVSNRIESQST